MEYVMQSIIVPIFIGILSSLISSLIFLIILSRLRPSIDISSQIAKFPSKKYRGVDYGYAIKVINKSSRSAIELRVRIAIVKNIIVPGGPITRTSDIKIEKNWLFELPGLRKNQPEASAFRFITYEDLDNLWDDTDTHLIFVIFAKDSLTSLGKVFTKQYYLKRSCVKEGTFCRGSSFEIV